MDTRSSAFRNLLYNLVRRDLAVRYKSTVLGFFWSFAKPLALTGIFWLVFDFFLDMRLDEERASFTLHLLTGILAWTFFSGATFESMHVILNNSNLIKKVKLPLAVFPVSMVASHMIHFLLGFLVLAALLIICGYPPNMYYIFLPVLFLIHYMVTLAISFMLAALNVFYRDLGSIWEVLSNGWFYATPILYPASLAISKLDEVGWTTAKWLFYLNPMTPIILAYRRILLYGSMDNPVLEINDQKLVILLVLCVILTGLMLLAGRKIFNRFAWSFADEL
jgi:lipopolysaccharide transport system permease protein